MAGNKLPNEMLESTRKLAAQLAVEPIEKVFGETYLSDAKKVTSYNAI